MTKQRVRKAVIPVAGLGTRFLPATKAVPKEMLPIVDVPAIQLVVQEIVQSGLEEVILITARGKESIVDHFDFSYELEDTLARCGKTRLAKQVGAISNMVRVVSIRQKRPLGLGHAILCARHAVGEEPFAVLLPDDIFVGDVPATRQLLNIYEAHDLGVVGLLEVPPETVSMYGIIAGELAGDRLYRLIDMIEKPAPADAPSNLAIPGRYVFPPSLFGHLEATEPGHGGEIQLTDAAKRLTHSEGALGYVLDAVRYDVGDKLGFLKATLAFALQRPDLGPSLRAYLLELLGKDE